MHGRMALLIAAILIVILAVSCEAKAVYGLKGLLINPLKTQMGSDVEFFDSRMKPTSNRND